MRDPVRHFSALATPAALALVAATLVLGSCGVDPAILAPLDRSAVDAGAASIPVEIELGGLGPAGSYAVRLLAGVDGPAPVLTDLTPRFSLDGSRASADLDPAADLQEGRNSLFVSLDADGDGTTEQLLTASFSYEPQVDIAESFCDFTDPTLCLYPFPSDFYTRADATSDTGRRIAFVRDGMPVNVTGEDVDPTEWNRNDGFSPGQAIQTIVPDLVLETPGPMPGDRPIPVPGAVPIWDIARSLAPDASFLILDWETGERVPLWAELNQQLEPEEGRALLVRPAVNFASGRRYVVALRNLRDAGGSVIEAQRPFRIYRDEIPTYVPEIEARRARMDEILAVLEQHGVEREGLYLAWDFTVISKRNMSERLLAMRDDAFEVLGDDAPSFSIDSVEDRPGDPRIRLRIRGTFQVPLYLGNDGAPGGTDAITRLYCEDELGQERLCEGDELPQRAGEFTAKLFCVVPRSASADGNPPALPARASLYGHGLLGSGSETFASHVSAMAFGHNFVFCGSDWVGMADEDFGTVSAITNSFTRFPTLADRLHQAMVNFMFLGRLMIHPDGLISHEAFQDSDGTPLIDLSSGLFYDGNSQGALAGGALSAFAQDYTRAVLGVNGMNYSTLLFRSVDFAPFFFFLDLNYPDRRQHPLLFALAQMLWDRVEANGHANHLTSDPYPNTPAKKILLHTAFMDHQVANVTAEVQARTIGAKLHRPAFDPAAYADQNNGIPRAFWQEQPFWNIPGIPASPVVPPVPGAPDATYRYDGSAIIIWDSGNLEPPAGNVAPAELGNPELSACALDHGEDPHECPRRQPSAQLQKSEFLRPDGAVVDVCGGEVCLAPLP